LTEKEKQHMTALAEIQDTLQTVASHQGPAIVGLGRGWGTGSGVIIAPGRVLVSAHSVRDEQPAVTFADGSRREARLLGSDPDLDLAVLEVDTADIEPLQFSDDEAGLGQAVVALANPGGRGLRATLGFVSSAERSFRGPRGRRIQGALEHTAPLPRGSSGSPLLDLDGRIIAINAVRADGGLILALPADQTLRERVSALSEGQSPRRVRLGVALAPARASRELRRAVGLPERPGLLVRGVQDSSPAAAAGVQRGDLIVALNGRETARIDDLHEALDAATPGADVPLAIVRGSDELSLAVDLGGER
jgi:serine protease Do